jgi:hypothetical protein
MILQSHFVNELVENHALRDSFCFRSYVMEASVATLHKTVVEKIVLLANFAPPPSLVHQTTLWIVSKSVTSL